MIVNASQAHLESCERLSIAMKCQHISYQDLAKQVTFSRQYLYKLIQGKQDLVKASGRVLMELSQVLGVSTDFLLGLERPTDRESADV